MDYMSHFAERLRELMIEKGLNPKTLADVLGINRTTITRYLNGTRQPSVATFVAIADYFHCTADFLLGIEDVSRTDKFNDCPPFSEQLHIILDKANKTKYELCKITKIAETAVYDWQRGDNVPSLSNVYLMAKKLDLSADFILGRVTYD